MPRVHKVKAARKDYPDEGIKRGDTYYWWKLYRRAKKRSKSPPRRQDLTGSGFLRQVYDIEDAIAVLTLPEGHEELDVAEIISDIESLSSETEGNLDNMPDELRDTSESGQLLQERVDNLEEWSSNLENADTSVDENLSPEDLADRQDDILATVQGYSYEGS